MSNEIVKKNNLFSFFKDFIIKFKQSSYDVKISYFIMGFSHLVKKQFLSGIFYLGTQIAFIYYMITNGVYNLINFTTLGTKSQEWVYSEERQINILVPGDNSMLILIMGVMAIVIIMIFTYIYFTSVFSALSNQQLLVEGKSLPTFKEKINILLNEKFHITLLTLPVLAIVIFTVLPLIFMILIAFTNFDSTHQPPGNLFTWVGLENFNNMLFANKRLVNTFIPILQWTLVWAISATSTCYIFGIMLAMMINKKGVKFKKLWRTIFVITIAMPQFISLLVMRNLLNDFGPVNQILLDLNLISSRIPFLTDPTMARISVIVVNIWVGVPYTMLITTGILMNIPQEQYESATIEGANVFQMFFKITLPYLFFVMAPHLITSFIGNINNFSVIFLLTEGNPVSTDYFQAGKTDLLVTWLYRLTSVQGDYNLASTIGILVFIISVVLSLSLFRLTPSYKNEEDYA